MGPVSLVFSNYTRSETRDMIEAVRENEHELMERWRAHFGDR